LRIEIHLYFDKYRTEITLPLKLFPFIMVSIFSDNVLLQSFLAHLAEGHASLWYGAVSICHQLFPLMTSSQEPLGQFHPNLVGNMLGDVDSDLF